MNNNLIKRNDLKVNKVTIKGKSTIINTPLGQFVLKKGNIDIYNYLLSRGFNYFPKIIDYDNEYLLFEYIDDVEYDINEKAKDFIKILSLLHAKTAYYINTYNDEFKSIYEEIKTNLNNLYNYYDEITNMIETKEYMSPSEYLLIRNISIIFSAISYCNKECDEWYDLVKKSNKKRVSTLYNNIDLNNLLKNKDSIYLISFDKTTIDNPIYDLFNFFNKYDKVFYFNDLIKDYEKIFPLNNEEKKLLYLLISIPPTISIGNSVNDIKQIKKKIDRIFRVLSILNSKEKETTTTHEKKDN